VTGIGTTASDPLGPPGELVSGTSTTVCSDCPEPPVEPLDVTPGGSGYPGPDMPRLPLWLTTAVVCDPDPGPPPESVPDPPLVPEGTARSSRDSTFSRTVEPYRCPRRALDFLRPEPNEKNMKRVLQTVPCGPIPYAGQAVPFNEIKVITWGMTAYSISGLPRHVDVVNILEHRATPVYQGNHENRKNL
jgi:hypothetical protein